jgi:hypothetical protein
VRATSQKRPNERASATARIYFMNLNSSAVVSIADIYLTASEMFLLEADPTYPGYYQMADFPGATPGP